jgi:hypothetical protein
MSRAFLIGATIGYVSTAIAMASLGLLNTGTLILGPAITVGWMLWSMRGNRS